MSQPSVKILRIEAENVKRLRAINLELHDGVVVITGRNEQGKTSALDVAWLVLAGGDASKAVEKVIRDGTKEAWAQLTLSNGLVAERTWRYDKHGDEQSKIEVRNMDGAVFKTPQKMLDDLFGVLTFDPFEFDRMKPADQIAALVRAIGKGDDLATIDAARKAAFEKRTDENRRVRDVQGELTAIPEPGPDDPTEEITAAEISSELEAARAAERTLSEAVGALGRARADKTEAANRVLAASELAPTAQAKCDAAVTAAEQEYEDVCKRAKYNRDITIADAHAELAREIKVADLSVIESTAAALQAADAVTAWLARVESLPQVPDQSAIRARLDAVAAQNAIVARNRSRAAVAAKLEALEAAVEKLNAEIATCDELKRAIIGAAGLPIPGLGMDDTGVTIEGHPWKDCAKSKRIRASVAIAMALNPRLHFLRILDGSLLDTESMGIVAEMAAERDYQILVERVDDSTPGCIVIEDGAVVGAEAPAEEGGAA